MNGLAALAVAAAVWLGLAPPVAARLRALTTPRAGPRRTRVGWVLPAVLVASASGVGALGWGTTGFSIAIAVSVPAITGLALVRRHREQRAADAAATEVARACQQLAGLVRVGQVPADALRLAARDSPMLAVAAANRVVGGDVAAALREQATEAGCSALGQLAAAWEVAERSGASLTTTLDALVDRLSAERSLQAVVASELSAAKATGRVLAGLPLAGLALGFGVGGDPLGFLIGSLPGQICLVAGSLLASAGVLWTERIASQPR